MNLFVLFTFILALSSTALSYPYYFNRLDQDDYPSLGVFMPELETNLPYQSNWPEQVLFNKGTEICKICSNRDFVFS